VLLFTAGEEERRGDDDSNLEEESRCCEELLDVAWGWTETYLLLAMGTSCLTCSASQRSFTTQEKNNRSISICGETRNSYFLSVENLNRSRHLVFWSLKTLTGLRDRVRRLVV
jgi:hypothetical protein